MALAGLVLAACGSGAGSGPGRAATGDPAATVAARPDYTAVCAPSGLDTSTACLQVTLAAVDAARAGEGLGPMRLPATFPRLDVVTQLFVVIDTERVDRGLAPFDGISAPLSDGAGRGARAGGLPPEPGRGYGPVDAEWAGQVLNGLDADYQWMYDDGPGSGTPDCPAHGGRGCWADRHILLDPLAGTGSLVMGAALDPTGDRSQGDPGGPSLAVTLARAHTPETLTYTWAQARAAVRAGTLRPRTGWPAHTSASGLPDPPANVAPQPDYTRSCARTGLDDSPGCTAAVLAAIDSARAREGVGPMVLPADYRTLDFARQMLVVIDRERVDRGLAPFTEVTAPLVANARKGAGTADDPPDPGSAYDVVDGEWAGGSVNVLDAVYGWMYDDGYDSGNLDCPKPDSPGCWGHREGILDNFGTVGTLVMGAALDPTGDISDGDRGGTSMAATLAISRRPPGPVLSTWERVRGSTSPSAPARG